MSIVTPPEVVQSLRAFQTAMEKWNDDCVRASRSSDEDCAYKWLAEIVVQHCTPRDLSCVGVSYCGESDWSAKEEIVDAEQPLKDECHVTTVRESYNGLKRYRYELLRIDGRWLIDGRYSIVGGTDYPDFLAPLLARRTEHLWELYQQFALESFAKQSHLVNLVGEADWQLDTEAGKLTFNNGHCWQCQILGTEAEESSTWLWAWANRQSDVADEVVQAAQWLKEYGEQHNIRHFVEPTLPINEVDGRFIATLATGLLSAQGYYCGPYDGGGIFLLITDESVPEASPDLLETLERGLTEFMEEMVIANPRSGLMRFLAECATELVEAPADKPSAPGEQIQVEYDKQGRISQVDATFTPGDEGAVKRFFKWLRG